MNALGYAVADVATGLRPAWLDAADVVYHLEARRLARVAGRPPPAARAGPRLRGRSA